MDELKLIIEQYAEKLTPTEQVVLAKKVDLLLESAKHGGVKCENCQKPMVWIKYIDGYHTDEFTESVQYWFCSNCVESWKDEFTPMGHRLTLVEK